MRLQHYKLLLILLFPIGAVAGICDIKPDRSKYIEKSFNLSKDGTLEIQNSFGNVTITTWDKEQVYIKVTVEVTGGSDDKINERLRDVEVDFNASTFLVSARTAIDENNSLWSWLKKENRTNLKVHYEISMPVSANLDVQNDYGTISLDKLQGHATLRCDFGRLAIGQLLHDNNELRFDYTKNSHIDYMRSGTIKADFSVMKVYGSERVNLSGDYSTFNFVTVKNLDFNADFSTITVDKAVSVMGRGDYSTLKFGSISKKLDLNTDFGSITVTKIESGFSKVTIRTEYTKVAVGYDAQAAFEFIARVEYASLRLSDNLKITRSESDYDEKLKAGYHINQNSASRMELRSEFGAIVLKEY